MPTQTNISALYASLEYLQHRKIKLWGQLTLELVEQTIAASGVGLDHCIGERVLAIGDDPIREKFTRCFMLTDRRLVGRRFSHFFHAQLTDIKYVQANRSLLNPDLKIHLASAIVDIELAPFVRPLGVYLNALCQVPPEQRTPPIQPLLKPTPDELMSDEWLKTNLSPLPPTAAPLFESICRRFRLGTLSFELASNLAQRISLLSRTLMLGRGMRNAWWLTPLTNSELEQLFIGAFGKPVAAYQQDEVVTLDFQLGGGSGAGKAAASTAVGLAALGLLGIGWVSIPGRSLKYLRVAISETNELTYFSLQGLDGSVFRPLSALSPAIVRKLFQILAQYEIQLLRERCLTVTESQTTNEKTKRKTSTLLIVSRQPGRCGTCRHANQETADFREGHVFCQFGGGALNINHICDQRIPAFHRRDEEPELYYCYEPFTGNNGTWQKLQDTRVLAADADDEMRICLKADEALIT
jgi:hypothetical protein